MALIVLVGLPGAGKTTLCAGLTQSLSYHCLHVCYDKLVRESDVKVAQSMEQAETPYKAFRSKCLCVIINIANMLLKPRDMVPDSVTGLSDFQHQLYQEAREIQPSQNVAILVDDNMFYRSMRYKLYQLAQQFHLRFGLIYFDIPLSVCIINNSKRPEPLPEDVIIRMSENLQTPDPASQPWEENLLVLSQRMDVDLTMRFISRVMAGPPVPELTQTDQAELRESRRVSATDVLHQADLVLRQLVKENIQSAHQKDVQMTAQLSKQCKEAVSKMVKETADKIMNQLHESAHNSYCNPESELYRVIQDLWKMEYEKISQ